MQRRYSGETVAKRFPKGENVGMDDEASSPHPYEYAPLRLPTDVNTTAAQVHLSIAAEYGGWELASVRRYADGTRKVTLRRRYSSALLPGLSY